MKWLVLIISLSFATLAQADLNETFDRDVLTLEASRDACYRFDIYLAESNAQRAQGLMYVRELPVSTGMWFVYEREARVSIWMKNTYIPLDIVYVKADGRVSSVFHDAEPLSLRSMPSDEPVQYVLELNGGLAAKLGIDGDSRIYWEPATTD
ncbi:MAG: DUF192 domain-containing protein [Pseudomonadota bacterium]